MTYDTCPRCDHNHKASLLSGSYFDIYECTECAAKYCYQCPGSNGARQCPACDHTGSQTVGSVYLR